MKSPLSGWYAPARSSPLFLAPRRSPVVFAILIGLSGLPQKVSQPLARAGGRHDERTVSDAEVHLGALEQSDVPRQMPWQAQSEAIAPFAYETPHCRTPFLACIYIIYTITAYDVNR